MKAPAFMFAVLLALARSDARAATPAPTRPFVPIRPIPPVGPSPITSDCRYLFVVDTSSAMQRYADGLYRTTHRLIATGLGGRMQEGDVFTLWTYADTVLTREFPLNAWTLELNVLLANRTYEYLATQKFRGKSNLRPVFAELGQALAISTNLTIVVISDGTDVIVGTPFDRPINVTYGKRSSELRTAKMPFITSLVTAQGEFTQWSVRGGLEDIGLPMPARPPPPVPTVAEVIPPTPLPAPVPVVKSRPPPPPAVTPPPPKPAVTNLASVPPPPIRPATPAIPKATPPMVVKAPVEVVPARVAPTKMATATNAPPAPIKPPPTPVMANSNPSPARTNVAQITPPPPAAKVAPTNKLAMTVAPKTAVTPLAKIPAVVVPAPPTTTNDRPKPTAQLIQPPPAPKVPAAPKPSPVAPVGKPPSVVPPAAKVAKTRELLVLPAIPPAPAPVIPPALRQPKSLIDASNALARVELLRRPPNVAPAATPARPLEARILPAKPAQTSLTNRPPAVAKPNPVAPTATGKPAVRPSVPEVAPLKPQPITPTSAVVLKATTKTTDPKISSVATNVTTQQTNLLASSLRPPAKGQSREAGKTSPGGRDATNTASHSEPMPIKKSGVANPQAASSPPAKSAGQLAVVSPRASPGGWIYLAAAVALLGLAGFIIAYLLRPQPSPSVISQSLDNKGG